MRSDIRSVVPAKLPRRCRSRFWLGRAKGLLAGCRRDGAVAGIVGGSMKGFGRLIISLRRQRLESAKSGNVLMLIWLGKQSLDQADKRAITQEAPITEKVARLMLTAEGRVDH